MDSDWSSGYRITAGYMCPNDWLIDARYTHYHGKASDFFTDPNDVGELYYPTYTLNYNTLNFEVGSWFNYHCTSRIRPYVSLCFSWLDIHHDFKNVTDGTTPTSSGENITDDIDAYGFNIGFDFKYDLCKRFDFVLKTAFGAHYGNIDWEIELLNDDVVNARYYGKDCQLLFSSEIAIGLETNFCTLCGTKIAGSIGYEFHGWNNIEKPVGFGGINFSSIYFNSTSILLHGLYVRLGASF